jgi:hypothetical protein
MDDFLKYILFILGIILISCSNKNTQNQMVDNNIIENIVENKETVEEEIENNNLQAIQISSIWGEKIVDSLEGLNIRKEPSQNSEKIYSIPNGSIVYLIKKDSEKVNIDGINNYWFFVQYNETVGWVFGGYLKNTEKDDIKEILKYRMMFTSDFQEDGRYVFDSIMIESSKNMNNVELYMIDEKTYFKLTQIEIENDNYIFEYNYQTLLKGNHEFEKKNVIINKKSSEPFFEYLGELGGGYTNVSISLIDNRLLILFAHEQVDMSKIKGDI